MTWKDYFLEIAKIPRPSGKEEKIRGYLIRFAEEKNFAYSVDGAGNLSIDVPAAAGFETHAGVLIQGHMDMVCVKTETSPVDFERDPIPVVDDGKRLSADGTSLGWRWRYAMIRRPFTRRCGCCSPSAKRKVSAVRPPCPPKRLLSTG